MIKNDKLEIHIDSDVENSELLMFRFLNKDESCVEAKYQLRDLLGKQEWLKVEKQDGEEIGKVLVEASIIEINANKPHKYNLANFTPGDLKLKVLRADLNPSLPMPNPYLVLDYHS